MMLDADKLCCSFSRGIRRPPVRALDEFSVCVDEGSIFGLLGPNGAGKSTAMHCFLGLIQPDAGRIQVNGQVPFPGSPSFEDVVYLPEEPIYHPYLRVREAVAYYAKLYQRDISRFQIDEVLDRVDMLHFARHPISQCSKGMKQKVGLAGCMLFTPKILFLDEPTRGLDPVIVRDFRDYLLEANKQGCTIILNSHVLSEVELVCNQIAIMKRGRVLKQGALHDLVHSSSCDVYTVEMDAVEELPAFFQHVQPMGRMVSAEVKADQLGEVIRFFEGTSARMYSCQLHQESLEDVFMRVIEEDEV